MKHLCFITSAIAIFLLGASTARAATPYAIEVQAAVAQCSAERIVLAMKLKNAGEKKIELYKSDLPWGIKSSIVMAIVTNTPDPEMVEPAHYIDDPGPGLVMVNPAEILEGKIDLLHRFPGLSKALQKRDLLVFWSYNVELPDGTITSRQSGSVLLERARCSSKTM